MQNLFLRDPGGKVVSKSRARSKYVRTKGLYTNCCVNRKRMKWVKYRAVMVLMLMSV
jgi:hypothetical protein